MYFLLNYDMMEGNEENGEKDEGDSISKAIIQKEYLMAIWN